MSLRTVDSLPPAAELNGHSRDSDETVQTIEASSDFDATNAIWIVVDRQWKKRSAKEFTMVCFSLSRMQRLRWRA